MRSLLVVPLLVVLLAAPAGAAGEGSPVVLGPPSSTPQYAGFDGPFDVDFSNAPPSGGYTYWVQDESAVVVGTKHAITWDGSGSAEQLLTTEAIDDAGTYTFVVHQDTDEVPNGTLTFTVRAGARPACSLALPRVLRVGTGQEKVVGRLGTDCAAAHVTYASWDVYRVGGGFLESLQFPARSTDSFSFFATKDRLGSYVAIPNTATNPAGDDFRRNSPRIDVRLDSRLALRTHRTGRHVTLSSTLTKYLPGANRYGAWAQRPVTFSYRTCGTCAWHRLAVRRTDRHGDAVLRLRTTKVRGYRVTAGGTAVVWAPHPRYGRR